MLDGSVSPQARDAAVNGAVRVGEPRDPGVVVRRLGLSPQVFVAAPSLPLPDPLTLEGLPVVLRIEGGARLDAGMLPAWLAEEALAAGRLRLVPAPFAVPVTGRPI